MDLGTVLVALGILLAVLSLVVDRRQFTLLAIGVISIGVGVLAGVETVL